MRWLTSLHKLHESNLRLVMTKPALQMNQCDTHLFELWKYIKPQNQYHINEIRKSQRNPILNHHQRKIQMLSSHVKVHRMKMKYCFKATVHNHWQEHLWDIWKDRLTNGNNTRKESLLSKRLLRQRVNWLRFERKCLNVLNEAMKNLKRVAYLLLINERAVKDQLIYWND